MQQSHLDTKEEKVTFKTQSENPQFVHYQSCQPDSYISYGFSALRKNTSGAIFKWGGINHQMSECFSSQGLSPLQPAGDKIQNATVQQAWHLPAGRHLSLTSFPPLQFLPEERSELFVQESAASEQGTAASLLQLSSQTALPTSPGPKSIHLPCSCNVTTLPIYNSGVFAPGLRLRQRSAKISLLTSP